MGGRLSFPTVDLSGRVAIVTGGNTGIGYETAKALAVMGAHTIIACRSEERAAEAISRMQAEVCSGADGKQINIEFMALDLASFQSVREFIDAFLERNLPLHILINNAGIAWVPLSMTVDGYELQLQVNHLGHFLLTLELLPVMLEAAATTGDCRIVFVSSSAHTWYNWEPANMNAELDYSRTKFYPYSKMYNVMTAFALQRRLQNVGITVSSLHPGAVNTEVIRGFEDRAIIHFFVQNLGTVFLRNAKQGAATTINCAVNPQLNSQQCFYYDSCSPTQSSADSRNEQYQEELWKRSLEMVNDFLSKETVEKYGAIVTEQDQEKEDVIEERGAEEEEEGVREKAEEQEGAQKEVVEEA